MDFRARRIASMLIDHFVMVLLMMPLAILIFLFLLLFLRDFMDFYSLDIHAYAAMFSIYGVYFLKDNWNGKSLGKRIIGLRISAVRDEKAPSSFQCFVRNLFVILWPLEVLIVLINPERRIGDFIAQTRVEVNDKDSIKNFISEIRNTRLDWNQVLQICAVFIPFCYLLAYFMVSLNA